LVAGFDLGEPVPELGLHMVQLAVAVRAKQTLVPFHERLVANTAALAALSAGRGSCWRK
jgi:hypothetical protein